MRVLACLFVSAALLLVRCGGDRSQSAEFRYTLTIAPGNYLFVYGHEFHGDVACTLEPGDSLRIGGLPVLPRRPEVAIEISEERMREVYGQVPFMQERVRQGDSWHQAYDAYDRRETEMVQSADRAYRGEMGRTGSPELAGKAALDSLDRSLLDPTSEPEVIRGTLRVKMQGLAFWTSFPLGIKPSSTPPAKQPEVVTPEKAMGFLRKISITLGPEAGSGWMEVLTGGDTILAGASVPKALKQIEEGEKGNLTTGPLNRKELEGILAVRRGAAN
jgi:hypothetical protein